MDSGVKKAPRSRSERSSRNLSHPVLGNLLTGLANKITQPPAKLNDVENALAAIANSPELVTLDEQIALIDERVGLMGDRIDYTSNKRWTNYLTTDPLRLVANIFGGGDVQRDNIAIADLEVKAATLEATRANLVWRRAEVKSQLREEILTLVLDYEAAGRQAALVESQLASHQIQQQLVEIDYRQGNGSTSQFLALSQHRERLSEQLTQHQLDQKQAIRRVLNLTGFTFPEAEKDDPSRQINAPNTL